MSSSSITEPITALPPDMREQVEDVAYTFLIALKSGAGDRAVPMPDGISAKTQRWIRGHAGEFGAYVVRQYRQFAV